MSATHDFAYLSSMTAVGISDCVDEHGLWVCEIHSVNRRCLDVQVHLPSSMRFLEIPIRRKIQEAASRGQVTCTLHRQGSHPCCVELDESKLNEMQRLWDALQHWVEGPTKMPFEFVLAHKEQLGLSSQNDPNAEIIMGVFEKALDAWQKMRKQEGQQLYVHLQQLLQDFEMELGRLISLQHEAIELGKQKIAVRWKQFTLPDLEPTRWVTDVLAMIDQHDIAEEIKRLESHLLQFRGLLQQPLSQNRSKGKKAEFLLQEMSRETHTVGSKSPLLAMIERVIEMKTILEQCKEQIQNIE